jgi:hypothetical protein
MTRIRPGFYSYSDEACFEALRLVAKRLGRSPRTTEYPVERNRIVEESRGSGKLVAIPSIYCLLKRWRWDEALQLAGLAPTGGRHTSRRPGKRAPRHSDAVLLDLLREAMGDLGPAMSIPKFLKWRETAMQRNAQGLPARPLPDLGTICKRFGGWRQAIEQRSEQPGNIGGRGNARPAQTVRTGRARTRASDHAREGRHAARDRDAERPRRAC